MTSGASRVIKLSKNLRPFVSRVVRNGAVQKAFTKLIGHPTGQCVAGMIPKGSKGYTGAQIHQAAKSCAPPKGTVHLGTSRRGAMEEPGWRQY
jgi:hypothetical protein